MAECDSKWAVVKEWGPIFISIVAAASVVMNTCTTRAVLRHTEAINRPWIGLQEEGVLEGCIKDEVKGDTTTTTVSNTIKNFGNFAAQSVRKESNRATFSEEEAISIYEGYRSACPKKLNETGIIIFPGSTKPWDWIDKTQNPFLDRWGDSTFSIYLAARVTYLDQFEKVHSSGWLARYRMKVKGDSRAHTLRVEILRSFAK